ncbi:MAG: hypothetical protein KIS67_19480 [Verrucomicrobiae bacterium]|nr:hypothetical protein [Verrucomicrobiae bacterium]
MNEDEIGLFGDNVVLNCPPMTMNAETITLFVAVWGAVTGTIAIAIQLAQHLADRSRLKLKARMSIESNEKQPEHQQPEHHVVFTLEVVNHGRRVSRIRRVGIELEPREMSIGGMNMKPKESEITLFDADKSGQFVELGEGKRHCFVLEPFPEKAGETFRETEVAFVTDTLGRKFTTNFQTIRLKDLPKNEP